ncbi:MAG: inositol monophosphatase family protein [Balneolales bacterium]
MTENEFSLRFKWLYPYLEETGRKLRLLHRNKNFSVKRKYDGSNVTNIDEEMSLYWIDLLSRAFPGEAIVTEEYEPSHQYHSHSDLVWYVDPIDGTGKFIEGSPNYFVLISLCIHGVAGFGILYQPERNCVLYGSTFHSARLYTTIHHYREMIRKVSWRQQMPLVVKGAQPLLRSRLEAVTHLPVRRTSSAVHNIIGPLSGPSSGFVSFRKNAYWDLAAPAAIMESAGFRTGIFSSGEPTLFNDGKVHCDRFYCLPPDTPEEVIEYVTSVTI